MQGQTEGNCENSFQNTNVLSETGASSYINAWIEQPADLVLCGVISHNSPVQLTLPDCMVVRVGWVEYFCSVCLTWV